MPCMRHPVDDQHPCIQKLFFLPCAFRPRICLRLIVSQQTRPARGNGTHSTPLLAGTMPGKRTVRRYEDENHTTDGDKIMKISLHTHTGAPNTAAATRVSPLDPSGSSKTKFSRTKPDIYQTVTDSIISVHEADVKPWSCPWQRVPGMPRLPSNYATGTAYSGMNIMLLWSSVLKQGFSDSRWMTYKHARVEGGQGVQGRTRHYSPV